MEDGPRAAQQADVPGHTREEPHDKPFRERRVSLQWGRFTAQSVKVWAKERPLSAISFTASSRDGKIAAN